MNEDIKSAIENLTEMYPKKCQMVDGRYTGGFDDYESEKGKAITLAIRSLKAWEETIQELEEHRRNGTNIIGLNDAIDIVNKHLSEIEEVLRRK